MRARVLVALLAAAAPGCDAEPPSPRRTTTTLLVHDALILDGSGAAAYPGSLRIEGDTILEVGELEPRLGEPVVEARGLVLAPGFIDSHSHHDRGLLEEPTALAAISQGITTIVAGQDGSSHHPLADWLAQLEAAPAAVNVASYSGHGTLRSAVLGSDFRRAATPEEIAALKEALRRDLEGGALGLSTGLEYDPGIYSTSEEVLELARLAAASGGRYISHLRSEDRHFWEALDEIVRIGREAQIPVQISHLKLGMRPLWGQAGELLARLDRARAEGIELSADLYPYTYWQSTAAVMFPERDFDDLEAARFAVEQLSTPEGIVLARFEAEPRYEGHTLAEVAAMRQEEPEVALLELVAMTTAYENETGEEESESVIATGMEESDVAALLRWPFANICTDGELRGAHPRGFGAFPRVLGHYVRELGVLSLEEAIRKMTSLAAENLGLERRGRIQPGWAADLVLLDPARVLDRSTPADPQAPASGIERVWVNGTLVYDGATGATGALPGRTLRRVSP